MEWNGNDHIETAAAQPCVPHRFAQPGGEGMTQLALPAVLEFVHEFADEAATAISGDRAVEMQSAMLAVRATERLRDRAGEWLGTFRTKRRDDPRRARPAIRAKILAPRHSSRADDAGRRVKKRAQGEQWISVCEVQHFSTILSS